LRASLRATARWGGLRAPSVLLRSPLQSQRIGNVIDISLDEHSRRAGPADGYRLAGAHDELGAEALVMIDRKFRDNAACVIRPR
jgi:hypothetical protein